MRIELFDVDEFVDINHLKEQIIDYINNGGNILWLNGALAQEVELPNVNKILQLYGVEPFEVGIIRETDSSKMVSNSPDLIMPEIQYTDVTSKLYDTEGVIFIIDAICSELTAIVSLITLSVLSIPIIS